MKDSFVFYRSFFEAIKPLDNPTDKLGVFEGICDYALNGKIPDNLEGISKIIFTLIQPQIKANNARYENGCKGGKSGHLGGRPKKKKTPKKPLDNPYLTPKKPLDNPKETPNENENDNVNDIKESSISRDTTKEKLVELEISTELWRSWKEHRKTLRKPVSAKCEEIHLAKLKTLSAATGKTATHFIELAIERGWQSFFEEPTNGNQNSANRAVAFSSQSAADKSARTRAAIQRGIDSYIGIGA